MNTRSLSLSFLLAMTLSSLPAAAQGPRPVSLPVEAVAKMPAAEVQQRLDKHFFRWQVVELDLPEIERRIRRDGRVQISAGGRVFDLVLQPHDLRTPEYREVLQTARGPVDVKPRPAATFKGHLLDDPTSVVRVLAQGNLFQGYIRTTDEWIFLDPLVKYAKGSRSNEIVLFDDKDVRPAAESLCGHGELESFASELQEVPDAKSGDLANATAAASLFFRRADVATDADFEYFSIFGGNTAAQIQGILNQVDGIYQADHRIMLRLVFQSIWTVAADPYGATDPNTLLNELRNFWNANRTDVNRDITHLFTGRDLDGTVIGIAWTGVVCNAADWSYGLSQNFNIMARLTAHEIGHNFNALHDNQITPQADACTGNGPIMCSWVQPTGPNTFSGASRTAISTHVTNNGACLAAIYPSPEPPVANFYARKASSTSTTVYFDGTRSYDPDAEDRIVSYRWDFGDGTTSTAAAPTHAYPGFGEYYVTLTVTDSEGLSDIHEMWVSVYCTNAKLCDRELG